MAALVQLGVSLAAILLLAGFARWLGLGGDRRLKDAEEARELARAAVSGFDPIEIALDRAGIGALLRDAQGRVMLLRRHGVHFAARILTSYRGTRLDRHLLTIDAGERRFGAVTLDLGPAAQHWAASLRRIGQ